MTKNKFLYEEKVQERTETGYSIQIHLISHKISSKISAFPTLDHPLWPVRLSIAECYSYQGPAICIIHRLPNLELPY